MEDRKIEEYSLGNTSLSYDIGRKRLIARYNLSLINTLSIPIPLSLVLKNNELVLNLEEHLEINDNSYKRIKVIDIEEYEELFYIRNNGRVYINKEDIEILPDGNITYNGNQVYKEIKNKKGIEFLGNYTGFKNSNVISIKEEELQSREEKILSLKEALKSIDDAIKEYSKYNNQKYNDYINKKNIFDSINNEYLNYKVDNPDDSETAALNDINNRLMVAQRDLTVAQKNYDDELMEGQNDKYSELYEINLKRKEAYENTLKKEEYECQELKKVLPLYFIKMDKLVLGYNENYKLSIIFDDEENEVIIKYDGDRIVEVTDNNNNGIKLMYDNNKLIGIDGFDGDKINIEYGNNDIIFNNSEKIELSNTNITNISYKERSIKILYLTNGYIIKSINNDTLVEERKYLYDGSKCEITNDKNDIKEVITFNDSGYQVQEETLVKDKLTYVSYTDFNIQCCEHILEGKEMQSILSSSSFTSKKTIDITNNFNSNTKDYIIGVSVSADSFNNINKSKITPYCSHEGNSCNVEFSIKVNLYYSDGITIYKDYFNPNIKGIQTKLILVSLKDEENSVIVPSKVELVVDYSNNNGNCTLDNVRLINGNYRYIKYDKAYNKVYEYYSQSNRPYSLNKKKRIKEEVYYTYNHNEQISNASKLELHIDGDEIYENITNIDYKYNSDNKLISSSDNKGNIIEYKYHDKYIQLLKYNKDNINDIYIEEYSNDTDDLYEVNSLGYKTLIKNLNDRLKEITSPTGNVIYETTIDNTTVLHCDVDGINNYTYELVEEDNRKLLKTDGRVYKYIYDNLGRIKEFYINDELYYTYTYKIGIKRNIIDIIFSKSNSGYSTTTDKYNNVLKISRIVNGVYSDYIDYELDSDNRVIKEVSNDDTIIYTYNEDLLVGVETNDFNKTINKSLNDNITINYNINNDNIIMSSNYNDNLLEEYNYTNNDINYKEEYNYDSLNRIVIKANNLFKEKRSYIHNNGRTADLVVSNAKYINNKELNTYYKYDKEGYIVEIIDNNKATKYTYDNLNRLKTEYYDNTQVEYIYDNIGNIKCKNIIKYDINHNIISTNTISYKYSSDNNLLLSYNDEAIIYNNMDRPINYRGNILEWDNKYLSKYNDISYKYNSKGIRTCKKDNSSKTEYIVDGNNILKEHRVEYKTYLPTTLSEGYISSKEYNIDYIYGREGLEGFIYNNKEYYYNKNILGDILEIYDKNYNVVAKYFYDAYGKCDILINVDDIANINPFRYRGYYYDKETKLYYLNSRYYDPEVGRFISPDSMEYLDPESINGLNLYCYCYNNPISYYDPTGHFAILTSVIVGAIIGFACSYIPDVVANFKDGFDWSDFNTFGDNWIKYVGATLGGAIGGLGTGIGTTVLFGGVGNVVSGIFSGDVSSFGDGLVQFTLGALTSGVAYGISKGISTKFASVKISKIIGSSSKNSKINANLAKKGFGKMKIGKMGMKAITKELYRKLGYENLQDGIGYVLDFGFGFLL